MSEVPYVPTPDPTPTTSASPAPVPSPADNSKRNSGQYIKSDRIQNDGWIPRRYEKRRFQPDKRELSSKTKRHKALRSKELDDYASFYETEMVEFMYGPMKSDLPDSSVSVLGTWNTKATLVGSFWSRVEKECFFEFLGRYGIEQVEKIQQQIPTKSILEIMNYYNLLKEALAKMKKKKSRFLSLIKYSDIPSAIEVDEKMIVRENVHASRLKNRAQRHSNVRHHRQMPLIRKNLIPNSIIDFERLSNLDLTSFYKNNSFIYGKYEPTLIDFRTYLNHDTYKLLDDLVVTFVRKLIRNIIVTAINNPRGKRETFVGNMDDIDLDKPLETFSRGGGVQMDKHLRKMTDNIIKNVPKEKQVLIFNVTFPEVQKALEDLNMKRPKTHHEYFKTLPDRLNTEIMDDDLDLSVGYGGIEIPGLDPQGREYARFVKELNFQGLIKFFPKHRAKPFYDDIDVDVEKYIKELKSVEEDPTEYVANYKPNSEGKERQQQQQEDEQDRYHDDDDDDDDDDDIDYTPKFKLADPFIVPNKYDPDEENDHDLLDSELLWYILSFETQQVNEVDAIRKDEGIRDYAAAINFNYDAFVEKKEEERLSRTLPLQRDNDFYSQVYLEEITDNEDDGSVERDEAEDHADNEILQTSESDENHGKNGYDDSDIDEQNDQIENVDVNKESRAKKEISSENPGQADAVMEGTEEVSQKDQQQEYHEYEITPDMVRLFSHSFAVRKGYLDSRRKIFYKN